MKTCSHCRKEKSFPEFSKNSSRKDGFGHYCKVCLSKSNKKARLKRTPEARKKLAFEAQLRYEYGLEPEDYAQILLNQNNRCALCNQEFKDSPQVDHCHKTGKIRGLLCRFCNQGLGMFLDLPDRLIAAAAYLQKT